MGLADSVHCFNSCGQKVWQSGSVKKPPSSRLPEQAENSSSSSSSSSDSAEDVLGDLGLQLVMPGFEGLLSAAHVVSDRGSAAFVLFECIRNSMQLLSCGSCSSGDFAGRDLFARTIDLYLFVGACCALLRSRTELCRKTSSILLTGHPAARVFLEEPNRENGIRAGAQIEGPTGTCFIVYLAGYLKQSIRHNRARYLAIKRAAAAMKLPAGRPPAC